MAKRKKRSKLSIAKQWYETYRKALEYYDIKVPVLKKPTTRSVHKLKTQWQGINKQLRKKGYIDLPNVYQASKYIREQESRPTDEELEPLNYGGRGEQEEMKQYFDGRIDEIKATINRMASNLSTVSSVSYKTTRSLETAKHDIIQQIDFAVAKTSPQEVADALYGSPLMARAEAYEYLESQGEDARAEISNFFTFIYDELPSAIASITEHILSNY